MAIAAQKNGVVKRKNRKTKEIARAMLDEEKVSHIF